MDTYYPFVSVLWQENISSITRFLKITLWFKAVILLSVDFGMAVALAKNETEKWLFCQVTEILKKLDFLCPLDENTFWRRKYIHTCDIHEKEIPIITCDFGSKYFLQCPLPPGMPFRRPWPRFYLSHFIPFICPHRHWTISHPTFSGVNSPYKHELYPRGIFLTPL